MTKMQDKMAYNAWLYAHAYIGRPVRGNPPRVKFVSKRWKYGTFFLRGQYRKWGFWKWVFYDYVKAWWMPATRDNWSNLVHEMMHCVMARNGIPDDHERVRKAAQQAYRERYSQGISL